MRILYFDLDSLRPDHLGCYGYSRPTSPHIDQLAAEGMRMTGVHCSDAPCLPSRTALYTGRFGIHTGVVSHGCTPAEPYQDGSARGCWDQIEETSFARFLQENGLYTAQISPFGQRHAARHFFAGFNEIHNTGKMGQESAEEVTPVVMDWLSRNGERDKWFLHVNYWDIHTPYRTPINYPNPFANHPCAEWITDEVFTKHRAKVGPHGAQEINMFDNGTNPRWPKQPGELHTREDVRKMFDGYDTAIRYVDDQIGIIIAWLKAAGVYEDTAIIVSADHGENMGELGIYGEHSTADAITTRIPMIIRWPGVTRPGSVDTGLHYHLDLPPTVADILDSTRPSNEKRTYGRSGMSAVDGEGAKHPAIWDGRSFARSLVDGSETGRESLVVGQCAHVVQRSVRFGDWMYIRTYNDGYHLFPKEMLFNLRDDPFEQHDVAESNRAVCDEAIRRMTEWHDAMMATSTRDVDPLWTAMHQNALVYNRGKLPAYCERLEATGRGWAVPELKRRHPHEFNS